MNVLDDDLLSTTNISLIEEDIQSVTSKNIVSSPLPISTEKSTSMALKHQESAVDVLKKENFDLRLSLYFYEERLRDMSPENIDKALKENVTLKVSIQKLTKELKKYKGIILDLNQALEIVQKRTCSLPHVTEQDKNLKKKLENYQDENDKLSKMMADLSAENLRLRTSFRENTECNVHEHEDIYRKYRQLKMKLEEYKLINNEYSNLKDKYEDLKMQNNELLQRSEEDEENKENLNILFDKIKQLDEENHDLHNENQDREQEIEALEAEVIKLLSHLEKKDVELKNINDHQDQDIEEYENHINKLQKEIMDMKIDSEKQYNELLVSIRDRDVRIATLEGNFEAKQDTMQRENMLLKEEINELQEKLQGMYENHEYQEVFRKYEERNHAYKALKQRYFTLNQKVTHMNESKNHDSYNLLVKLNDDLRRELDDRDRMLDKEKRQKSELKELHQKQSETISNLKKQLERKENMLTNSLLARDTLREKGEFMENILFEQATGGHSFQGRSDSAMSSF